MTQELWTAVDDYISGRLLGPDRALDEALRASETAGLPKIHVSACQGKLLQILAQSIGSQRILELGTLGGYSTIWLARALPAGGRLVTVEADPKHAEVARANLTRARVHESVDLRLGRASEVLPQLAAEPSGPFDFVFIDADKPSTPEYFDWAVRLSRRGSLIITDNVVRKGEVANPASTDLNVQGVRRFHDAVSADPRVSATTIQTVGSKGYDGFAIAIVL
jgi:predicted O-methyltransferase YrrM